MPSESNSFTINFFRWISDNEININTVCKILGNSPKTLKTWKSIGIPKSRQLACQSIMDKVSQSQTLAPAINRITHEPTVDQFDRWNRAAVAEGLTVEQWSFRLMEEAANAEPQNVKSFPKPQLMAAAGNGIEAEVIDWKASQKTINVKVCGLSMVPKLNDGDVIEMTLKEFANNPYPKKGLIYLWQYDGKFTVKKYATRAATEGEIERGEDYVYLTGGQARVKVLKSLNGDFSEIIIDNDSFQWLAWLDEK